MHEMSLAGGILRIAQQAAERERFSRVTVLRLEAGSLSGVEPRALRFALEAMSPGTCLDGARLEIETPDGSAWCLPCGQTVPLKARGDACPHCRGHQLQPTDGTELRVVDMLVND